MSNQIILWALLILPWFSIFFVKKETLKRFMPTAFLAVIISVIVVEVGVTLKWWIFKEYAYPLRSPSYIFSLNPLITIMIFRFTYGRFWLYLATDTVFNLGFSYLYIGYFLVSRGILQYLERGPLFVTLITTITGVLIYYYQGWQEGIFAERYKNNQK